MTFRIELPAYRGPLDLLLYLVRRQEVDLANVRLSVVVDQYIEYLDVLQELDVDGVGEFVELASLLMEMKSQAVLPQTQEEVSDAEPPPEETHDDLVRRLLEYKKVRDAAAVLDELGDRWQHRFPRMADDLPPRRTDPGEQPIADLEVWDLVSAFGRLIREAKGPPPEEVIHDDTPIHVFMERIHAQLVESGRVRLGDLFEPGMHKSGLVGMFLAVLELTRHHGVSARQVSGIDDLEIAPGPTFSTELNVAKVDNYDSQRVERSNLPIRPR